MKRIPAINRDETPMPQGWLTTFNDMMTLLMVFFVLLFSMGSMDVKRFENFRNSLQSAMGVLEAGRNAAQGMFSDRQGYASEAFAHLSRTQGLEAEYTSKGIQLTLDDGLLFQTGSADITAAGMALLLKVAAIVKPMERTIRVEGHTDDRPIETARFPSNWELSTARATRVVRFFIDHGAIPPAHLSAAGYGASKPRKPNDSPINRSMNRRVEIILGKVHSPGPEV